MWKWECIRGHFRGHLINLWSQCEWQKRPTGNWDPVGSEREMERERIRKQGLAREQEKRLLTVPLLIRGAVAGLGGAFCWNMSLLQPLKLSEACWRTATMSGSKWSHCWPIPRHCFDINYQHGPALTKVCIQLCYFRFYTVCHSILLSLLPTRVLVYWLQRGQEDKSGSECRELTTATVGLRAMHQKSKWVEKQKVYK